MNKLGMIKTLTLASLSVVVFAASIALAQTPQSQPTEKNNTQGWRGEGHGRGGKRGGDHRMGGMMFRGLNLTEDQKARMKQISQSFRERTQSLRQELRAKRQELHQANAGGTFNEALATQKLQESAGLQAKLMGEQFKLRQEMLSVLTADQKTQLEQKKAELKARWGERGHHKGERNQPDEQ
jgi:periplasmic protein CpxP/Spy